MASFVFLGYSRYVYRQLRYETDKHKTIQSGFLDKMYSGTGVPGAAQRVKKASQSLPPAGGK